MTENIPPAPQPQSYPSYPVPGADQNQAPYAAAQPYPPSQAYPAIPPTYGQQPYPPHPVQFPPGQQPHPHPPYAQHQYPPQYAPVPWGYQPLRPSSGYRVAAGIFSIACGAWLLLLFLVGVSVSQGPGSGATAFLTLMVLIGGLGTLISGIVVLAKQRQRGRSVLVTLNVFASYSLFVALCGLSNEVIGGALFSGAMVTAVPVLAMVGSALPRERAGL